MKRIVKYLLIIFTFFICFNVHAEEIEGVLSKNIIMYNLNDDEVIYEKNSNLLIAAAAGSRKNGGISRKNYKQSNK